LGGCDERTVARGDSAAEGGGGAAGLRAAAGGARAGAAAARRGRAVGRGPVPAIVHGVAASARRGVLPGRRRALGTAEAVLLALSGCGLGAGPVSTGITRKHRTWGLCPQPPRIYRFTATGTPARIGLLPRRIGLRREPSHSATLRPGPSALAVPYGTGGALRGAHRKTRRAILELSYPLVWRDGGRPAGAYAEVNRGKTTAMEVPTPRVLSSSMWPP